MLIEVRYRRSQIWLEKFSNAPKFEFSSVTHIRALNGSWAPDGIFSKFEMFQAYNIEFLLVCFSTRLEKAIFGRGAHSKLQEIALFQIFDDVTGSRQQLISFFHSFIESLVLPNFVQRC
jgi:hypothetical protein